MNSLVWVFATTPVTVAILAALFYRQVVSPGSEWVVIIAAVSLYATAFGAVQAYEGQKASQKIQNMDEEKDKRRRDTLVRHEVPHIMRLLNMLLLGMDNTALALDKHTKNGKIQTLYAAEYMYRRTIMHIDSIRSIEAALLDAELSEHHERLDQVLSILDEITPVPQIKLSHIERFRECADMVFHVIENMSREYNVGYDEGIGMS